MGKGGYAAYWGARDSAYDSFIKAEQGTACMQLFKKFDGDGDMAITAAEFHRGMAGVATHAGEFDADVTLRTREAQGRTPRPVRGCGGTGCRMASSFLSWRRTPRLLTVNIV